MSTAPAWECQCSVDVDVPVAFAWQFMTDVGNWSDPRAEFALEGPFASGSHGTTRMPGRPPAKWTIRNVEPGCRYTIEGGSFLEGAVLWFHWRFDAVSDGTTRLTLRVELCGEKPRHMSPMSARVLDRTSSLGCGGSPSGCCKRRNAGRDPAKRDELQRSLTDAADPRPPD